MANRASSPLLAGDIEVVRSISAFGGLPARSFDRLIQPASVLVFAPHECIFRQGDFASALFVVVHGWVKLYRITPAGEEAILHIFARGESFAEAAAFVTGMYPATADAASECRIVSIPAAHIMKSIREEPEIALAMLASMSRHLHRLVQDVVQLKAQSASQRLATFLMTQVVSGEPRSSISLPYEKALIAGRIGVKPETLSRAFSKLEAAGVRVDGATVTVTDIGKLRAFATGKR